MEDVKGVGAILREAREAKNLSVLEIEKAINVRSLYIKAVEDEEFDKAPGDVFVRGIIRSYGNYLGLDGLELVNMYKGSSAGEAARAAAAIREVENVKLNIQLKEKRDIGSGRGGFSMPEIHLPMKQIAAGIGVLAILGVGYFTVPKLVDYVQSLPAAQEEPVKTEAPAPAPVVPLDKVVVEMEATGDCWLEVSADGKEAFAGMLYDKDKKTFEAKEKLVVKYGNIDVMKVVYNGKPVDFSGQHGVVLSTYTKTE